jgi:hypothetical protein
MNLLVRLGHASSFQRCGRWLLLALTLSGCGKEEIRVYTAPKDKPAPTQMADKPVRPPRARPNLSWQLPDGWKETGPSQMSFASFSIPGAGGKEAQVSITQLAPLAGRDTMVVNMWREQLGLESASAEEVAKQLQAVDVGGKAGSLFDLTGKSGSGSEPFRIVTAVVHQPEGSWFYKLSGESALVEVEKPRFIEFLKSIQIKEAAAPATEAASSEERPKPKWSVPAQWKELPAGQMQVAKFAIPERGSAQAQVFVSVFPNDTGGTLANVNRWRRQLGLSEVTEQDLASLVKPLDPAHPEAMLVELTNKNKRLLGAIVPRGGSYWFYKLLGDSEAVVPEKDSFVAFAKSDP